MLSQGWRVLPASAASKGAPDDPGTRSEQVQPQRIVPLFMSSFRRATSANNESGYTIIFCTNYARAFVKQKPPVNNEWFCR